MEEQQKSSYQNHHLQLKITISSTTSPSPSQAPNHHLKHRFTITITISGTESSSQAQHHYHHLKHRITIPSTDSQSPSPSQAQHHHHHLKHKITIPRNFSISNFCDEVSSPMVVGKLSSIYENVTSSCKSGIAKNSGCQSAILLLGFVMNMQPSEAEAGFDVRLPPTADTDALKWRIANEWAPVARNMTYQISERGPSKDYIGRPLITLANDSNPWWSVFKNAINKAGGRLAKPEILASTTDARFIRQMGIPTLGFSPMKNTPILLHEHNEHLKDTVYLKGIEVYESLISSLSSFEGASP